MKIRTDFVANSSSSSFLIYGTAINHIDELIESEEMKDIYINEKGEDIYCFANLFGLDCYIPYNSTIYIGKSWSEIKDNQTGLEFKKEIEKVINKINPNIKVFDTYSESWYDG
jgi:hypothetical protein